MLLARVEQVQQPQFPNVRGYLTNPYWFQALQYLPHSRALSYHSQWEWGIVPWILSEMNVQVNIWAPSPWIWPAFLYLNLDFRYFWFLHCHRTNFVPLGSQMYNNIKIQSHPGINNFIIGCKGLIQTERLKIAWLGLAICVPQGFHEQQ